MAHQSKPLGRMASQSLQLGQTSPDGSEDSKETANLILAQLEQFSPEDPIQRCGAEALEQLARDPVGALHLADAKLHVFPFKDVDVCWRRLYTDASLAQVAHLLVKPTLVPNTAPQAHDANAASQAIGANAASQASDVDVADQDVESSNQIWMTEVVRLLDMALIMAGAPRREGLIEEIFVRLGQLLSNTPKALPADSPPLPMSNFDTDTFRSPRIIQPIERTESISLARFEQRLHTQPKPLVVLHAIDAWPALHERPWRNPEYLLSQTLGGRRLVPVELGRSYTDDGWSQRILTFGEFISRFMLKPAGHEIGYLAQHDLFAQIPSLRKDLAVPDLCFADPPSSSSSKGESARLSEPLLNAWFGPAGTISPLHTDPYHNILCQVVGKKYIRLYAPDQGHRMFPRGKEDGVDMSNTSQVPVDMVEMDVEIDEDGQFAPFREATYLETVLREGESLYIPVGWWHYVRSLTPSFSVSFWWN